MPRGLTQEFLAAAAALLTACPANAMALSGGAGTDYQTGPHAQSYRSALLFGTAEAKSGELTLAAIRYKDSEAGLGTGAFANAALTLASSLRLRMVGLRTFGESGFDSWKLRAGPELSLPHDMTLGAYYLRLHNDAPQSFDAGGGELGFPFSSALSGQVGFSFGRWTGGATTAQGSLSGTLRAAPHVLVLCEADLGRNVVTTSSASSTSGGGIAGGLPLPGGLGGGPTTQSRTDRDLTATLQLGARFLIP